MKNLQKGFIVPLLIAIIAVLVIGSGVYFYEKNKSQQVIQQSVTNNQTISTSTNQTVTSDWKTYTNNKYGFEIKYPSDWKAGAPSVSPYIIVFCPQSLSNTDPDVICNLKQNVGHIDTQAPIIFDLTQKKLQLAENNDQYVSVFNTMNKSLKFITPIDQIVTSPSVKSISSGIIYVDKTKPGNANVVIIKGVGFVNSGKYIVRISGDSFNGNYYPLVVRISDTQLSFSVSNNTPPGNYYVFIENSDIGLKSKTEDYSPFGVYIYAAATTDLKTYKNNDFGFSFKYPSDWNLHTTSGGAYVVTEQHERHNINPIDGSTIDFSIAACKLSDQACLAIKQDLDQTLNSYSSYGQNVTLSLDGLTGNQWVLGADQYDYFAVVESNGILYQFNSTPDSYATRYPGAMLDPRVKAIFDSFKFTK